LPELKDTADSAALRGRADGRAFLMGCDEQLARVSWAEHTMGGPVWLTCKPLTQVAFRDTPGLLLVGGARGSLSHAVTSGAKHVGTEGDALRRLMHVSGMGGTSWDG
jgi:hypothetical protein